MIFIRDRLICPFMRLMGRCFLLWEKILEDPFFPERFCSLCFLVRLVRVRTLWVGVLCYLVWVGGWFDEIKNFNE